ncbi:uncharacterized protein Pyn_28914 [Prunus yedoensis var. nudiflora]|uniref:DUF2828 domain-containing protein n=1 Tax=Prunus yedoensis var. nudiflora TaxID=2094558 RepID=A0A314ZF84_PRUYE|nr:uncharacterized protein Pyn_28914 [Prunus yedoensis var. nudiflora]
MVMSMMKPAVKIAKILSPLPLVLVNANKTLVVKRISQLTNEKLAPYYNNIPPPEPKQPTPADPKPQTLYTPNKEEDSVFLVAHFNNNNISSTLHFQILSSYGNPCLDFFFHVLVPNVEAEDDSDKPPTSSSYKYLKQLLPLAWSHNPLTTLKLICNLRDCSNDLGKSDEEAFYAAAFWLHQNHPKTLACNVASIAAEFSQSVVLMHDLVEILYRLLQGQDVRRRRKKEKAAAAGNHNNMY